MFHLPVPQIIKAPTTIMKKLAPTASIIQVGPHLLLEAAETKFFSIFKVHYIPGLPINQPDPRKLKITLKTSHSR